ncbi:protein phosphatase 2C domain-containing protein [Daejeonella lutea]|uniref:Serine/threonine protein phosphatase PrpC n=1 Tax=Daejeonella lutea TaxID=572036 RepID=A0A1T5ADB4_9SPHI|nr:protein phosphatase 2C domain-containing protein [Daejeonella lutea]SKB32673.1 Serine/threonine protein phosphatase PrpC [Daejeonella lutea]
MVDNFFGLTDTGKVRGNNEDTFIVQSSRGGEYILASAIDGVGGYSGGEIAAALARESIIEYFENPGGDLTTMMIQALVNANEKIYKEKIEVKEHDSMACVLTLAVVDIKNNQFHYIHVGDTRLYLLRDGSLVKLTKDQSFVGFLEDSGRLTEEAAMTHPKRNEINKALGFNTGLENDHDYFETGSSPFLPGDMILLCSDGLTDMVNKKDITDILTSDSSLEDMAHQLIDAANAKGGKDNITAVLVRNDNPLQKQEAVKPSAVAKKKVVSNEKPGPEKIVADPVVLTPEPTRKKSNSTAVMLLSILSIGLLASTIYLLWMRGQPQAAQEQVLVADSAIVSGETSLSQQFGTLNGDTLVLNDSVYREPITISKSVNFDTDTLYVLSRGKIVLRPDSSFKGPAFLIPASGRNIVLNGLTFDGFDIGIASQSKNVRLEGVKFINVRVPVQFSFNAPSDSFMNGTLAEIFIRKDSLVVPIKR